MTDSDPKRTVEVAPGPPPRRTAKGESKRSELDGAAETAARRIAESKATVPHIYLRGRIELTPGGSPPTEAEIVAALGRALRALPRLNSSYRDGGIEQHARVNVGVVTETAAGPLLPTIFDADSKSVEEIERELDSLRERAAAGALASPDLAGGTASLTVLAGPHALLPAVTPGQLLHLAVSAPRPAAVLADGEAVAGRALELGLACDGRAVRPAEAADLLDRLADRIGTEAGSVEY